MTGSVLGFLLDGTAAACVLALVLLEVVFLLVRSLLGRGAPLRRWISPMVAGAALALALLLAQSGSSPEALGAALSIAGVAHLLGYRQRWTA